MKYLKVLGLAAMAAMFTMAFVSATSAMAEVDEIVVCKKLVKNGELCPTGEFFPKGTVLLALATNPELKATGLPAVKCPDSLVGVELLKSMANPLPLTIAAGKLQFGELPKPELGVGCTNTSGVHTTTALSAEITAEPLGETKEDHWFLVGSGEAEILKPFGLNTTCIYGATGIKSLIHPDAGTHTLAHEGKGLAEILIKGTLSKKTGSGVLCPSTGEWIANYVVYLVDPPNVGEPTLGWLALYKELTAEEKKMQQELGQ